MTKALVYWVGLLLAGLMLLGLALNSVLPRLGVERPLSAAPILASFWVLVVLAAGWAWKRGWRVHWPQIDKRALPLLLLPAWGVAGAEVMNAVGSNDFSMLALVLIAAVPVLCIWKKLWPEKHWGFAIWMMALALLLNRALITNNLWGTDNLFEYGTYRLTETNGLWQADNFYVFIGYNTVLSTNILPTMLHQVTFIPGVWMVKVLYPVMLSLVPVAAYWLIRGQFGAKVALLSAFLAMSVFTFFSTLLVTDKQLVAAIFFAAFVLLAFDRSWRYWPKMAALVVLGVGVVLSHYATGFLLAGLFLIVGMPLHHRDLMNYGVAVVIAGVAVGWYSFIGSGNIAGQMTGLGESAVSLGGASVGAAPASTVVYQNVALRLWHQGSTYLPPGLLVLYIISQVLIVTGFIVALVRFFKSWKATEFLLLAAMFLGFLGAELVLPRFSTVIGMERIYLYCMMVLAPFLVVGLRWLIRRWALPVALGFTAVFFLTSTGFTYQLAGKPLSNAISLDGGLDYPVYSDQEMAGARWLLTQDHRQIFADIYAFYLFVQVDAVSDHPTNVRQATELTYRVEGGLHVSNIIQAGDYIYLRKFNLETGRVLLLYQDLAIPDDREVPIDSLGEFGQLVATGVPVFENGSCRIIQTTQEYEGGS